MSFFHKLGTVHTRVKTSRVIEMIVKKVYLGQNPEFKAAVSFSEHVLTNERYAVTNERPSLLLFEYHARFP